MALAAGYTLSTKAIAETQSQRLVGGNHYPANNATSVHKASDRLPPMLKPVQPDSAKQQASPDENAELKHSDATPIEKQRQDRLLVKQLATRDREVRAHEQAHVAVGGRFASAATYTFERGPDGVNYAVSGEVQISTSKEGTPQETLFKAQVVRRAALAPAEPSAQDYRVAAEASQLAAQARMELARLRNAELGGNENSGDQERVSIRTIENSGSTVQKRLRPMFLEADNQATFSGSATRPPDSQVASPFEGRGEGPSDRLSETFFQKASTSRNIQSYIQIRSFV